MSKDEPTIRVVAYGHWVSVEGPLFGRPSVRLRTGAGAKGTMTPTEIFGEIRESKMPFHIVLTGDPEVEPLGSFVQRAQDLGYRVSCVVSGAVAVDWFSNLTELVLTPPPPSFGEEVDLPRLHDTLQIAHSGETFTDVSLYVPVADERDYQFARTVTESHPSIPMWLGASGSGDANMLGQSGRLQWLAQRVVDDRWGDVTVVPHLAPWL